MVTNTEQIRQHLDSMSSLIRNGNYEQAQNIGELLLEDLTRLLRPLTDRSKTGTRSQAAAVYAADSFGGYGRAQCLLKLCNTTLSHLKSGNYTAAQSAADNALQQWVQD